MSKSTTVCDDYRRRSFYKERHSSQVSERLLFFSWASRFKTIIGVNGSTKDNIFVSS